MSKVITSIFRQREIEKLYELKAVEDYAFSLCHGSTTAIKVEGNKEKVISDKEIDRCDIEIPMLEVGDEFFLHNVQEIVKIKSRTRSSDGSITYYVEDKIVETENTQKSYDECKEKIEHWKCEKEKITQLETELSQVKSDFKEYKKKYKYEHRFFNRKL